MQADSLLTEPPGKPEKYTRQHQSTLGVTEECTSIKKKERKKERKERKKRKEKKRWNHPIRIGERKIILKIRIA